MCDKQTGRKVICNYRILTGFDCGEVSESFISDEYK